MISIIPWKKLLRFRKQKTDFKPDTNYTPFLWKRKEDDIADRDTSKSKGKGPQGMPQGGSSSQGANMATSMDVDGSAGGGTGDSSLQRSAAANPIHRTLACVNAHR